MTTTKKGLIEALYLEEGKAEIVYGQLVRDDAGGDMHGRAALAIAISLRQYEKIAAKGRGYGDNVGFLVDLPHRQSFSPDAAFYVGPRFGAKFLEGAPIFAAEVRSESDYGPAAEERMAEKRADYFAAGTLVVWDVDVLREELVRVYRSDAPDEPAIYRRDQTAEAEGALPHWTMPVEQLFE